MPMDHYCRGCGLECAWSAIADGVFCNECRAKQGLPALARKHGPGGRGTVGPCDPDCAKCAAERTGAPTAGAPVIDGISPRLCFQRWAENRTLVEHGENPAHVMTPDQIAEAKRHYGTVARHTWMQQLRARIAARKEAERNAVVLEQDAEDFEW